MTAPASKPPTWEKQPAELSKVPGPGSLNVCPSDYLGWDTAPTLQQAIDAGRTSLTLVLRLPDGRQHNPRFGRTQQPFLVISLEKNQAPDVPTSLTTSNRACAESPVVGRGDTRLAAIVTDPDDYQVGAEFAWWPVAHPDQRQTTELGKYWTPGYPLWVDLAHTFSSPLHQGRLIPVP